MIRHIRVLCCMTVLLAATAQAQERSVSEAWDYVAPMRKVAAKFRRRAGVVRLRVVPAIETAFHGVRLSAGAAQMCGRRRAGERAGDVRACAERHRAGDGERAGSGSVSVTLIVFAALILIGRVLGATDHAASRLYAPGHVHLLRPKRKA